MNARNSKRVVLLIHEIYGVNEHMMHAADMIKGWGFDVECPNLFARSQAYSYQEEEQAYKNFMSNVGIEKGVSLIRQYVQELKEKYEQIYLVGYSVGATIAWLCSEDEWVDGVIGYYGSRIRDHLEVESTCPVLLFFSESEKSFNVQELVRNLLAKENEKISLHTFPTKHGYANPYSPHFSQPYYTESLRLTKEFLVNKLPLHIDDIHNVHSSN
ncbi:dienelactone hydrolase family protein [Metabacillus iocasae]|uniref:Dienelactone hydrolase n=1 Tax=Priestia iocasae TaxID=2291674 RepID=A0ABS2QTN9_9BACI|nr:dienelactone hydrolase family protein [Metabacillus iocasae]MBM7702367.1 dienelactone hydrolase [Metabacillus iocasae]